MKTHRSNAIVWFGVLGGPFAWAVVHVTGYALGLARCDSPNARFQIAMHGWATVLSAAGVIVALLAEAVSLQIFRETREAGQAPGAGRIHFLATIGLTVNPLAMTIMVLDGVGVALLRLCQQS